MVVDADRCWIMLINADWCWLMLKWGSTGFSFVGAYLQSFSGRFPMKIAQDRLSLWPAASYTLPDKGQQVKVIWELMKRDLECTLPGHSYASLNLLHTKIYIGHTPQFGPFFSANWWYFICLCCLCPMTQNNSHFDWWSCCCCCCCCCCYCGLYSGVSNRAFHCDAVHRDLGQPLVVAKAIRVVVVAVSGVVGFAFHRCVRKSLSLWCCA